METLKEYLEGWDKPLFENKQKLRERALNKAEERKNIALNTFKNFKDTLSQKEGLIVAFSKNKHLQELLKKVDEASFDSQKYYKVPKEEIPESNINKFKEALHDMYWGIWRILNLPTNQPEYVGTVIFLLNKALDSWYYLNERGVYGFYPEGEHPYFYLEKIINEKDYKLIKKIRDIIDDNKEEINKALHLKEKINKKVDPTALKVIKKADNLQMEKIKKALDKERGYRIKYKVNSPKSTFDIIVNF